MTRCIMLGTKRILVLNGPNLNLLGQRESEIYGTQTLDEIQEFIRSRLGKPYPDWEWFQSNSEAELIERIPHCCLRILERSCV